MPITVIAEMTMAGIAAVCSPPNMTPYGARVPGVHNSPIAIAVPGGQHRPLVLDMATSVAAGGKVSLAIDKGIEMLGVDKTELITDVIMGMREVADQIDLKGNPTPE